MMARSDEATSARGSDRSKPPYETLRDAIVDGTLAPGASLVESALATWCGVSRTPIREALGRLEQDGLVHRAESGLVVRERSPEEILDIYQVRIVVESTAAQEAARRRTEFDCLRLEKALRTGEEAEATDGVARARLNREFHRVVWLASHNEALIDLLHRLSLHLVRYPATTLAHPGRWEEGLKQHREMADAIVSGDQERAAEISKQHFARARDIRLEMWQQDLT